MNLEQGILLAVLAVKGDPIYADQVQRELPQFIMARVSLADLNGALAGLERKGELTGTEGSREDDKGRPMMAWFITPKGKNRAQNI
jgi:hypothetical protein